MKIESTTRESYCDKSDQLKHAVLITSVAPYMLKTSNNPDGVDPPVFDEMTQAMKDDRATFWLGVFPCISSASD